MSHVVRVEPDRVLAATFSHALMSSGYTVTPCASAQAAIFACDQKAPDVIILEPQLIDHSGIEFLYELRSYPEWQEIPVILHTQIPPNEFNTHGQLMKKGLGVANYLYKPSTNLKTLIKTLDKTIKVSA